ncbi:AAA ATPase midasin [Blastocladiella emersonii ATCC 22665]|nr:AAA ATPase midasin [Blastocladiella emersonii ATCC 22665]
MRQLQGSLELELQVRLALQIRENDMSTNPTIEWLRARLAANTPDLPAPTTSAFGHALHHYPEPCATQLAAARAYHDARLGPILSRLVQLACVAEVPLPLAELMAELTMHEASTLLQVRKKATWSCCRPSPRVAFKPLVDEVTVYHLRLVALMTTTAKVLRNRSHAIQHNQVERAVGYAADLYKLVVTERRALAPVIALVADLDALTAVDAPSGHWTADPAIVRELLALSSIVLVTKLVLALDLRSPRAAPAYSHLEQDGKESGDVEGVDGQDDAAPASKRSRTSDSSSRRLSDSEFLMGIKEVFQSVATADSKPVLTAALEWVQDAYNDNEEYQIDVATRLTEDQALRVMAVSESKRKRILEIFIQ